jgi:hypothetical protein
MSLPVVPIGGSEREFSVAKASSRDEGGGVNADPPPHVYVVQLVYRERAFEASMGFGPHPYSGTFEVVADNPARAAVEAIREFRRIESQSLVNWSREIMTLDVKRAMAPEGGR